MLPARLLTVVEDYSNWYVCCVYRCVYIYDKEYMYVCVCVCINVCVLIYVYLLICVCVCFYITSKLTLNGVFLKVTP